MEADVAIIGGGYYGATAALEIQAARPDLNVVILEREAASFGRASSTNQGQLHLGYLYSKFPQVAQECIQNVTEFTQHYAEAVNQDDTVYYGIHRDSEISAKDYEAFCASLGLPLQRVAQPSEAFFGSPLASVYKTAEKTFSNARLQHLLQNRLTASHIKTVHSFPVDIVRAADGGFLVANAAGESVRARTVINATFADGNALHKRSGFAPLPLDHAVFLHFLVDLPKEYRGMGLSVVRGPFAALAPNKDGQASHILASGQFRVVRSGHIDAPSEAITQEEITARYKQAVHEAAPYMPALHAARFAGHTIGTRTNYIDPATHIAASRAVVLENYGDMAGYHCVFGGKVTCLSEISAPLRAIAKEL